MSAIGPGEAHDFSIYVQQRLGVVASALTGSTREKIGEVLREIGNAVEEVIFSVWPVDTGRSLSRWRVFSDPDDLTLHIENPVHYASWVHPAGTAGTVTQDELGDSPKGIRERAEEQWNQKAGKIRALIEADGAAQREAGTLIGSLFGAALQQQIVGAVAPEVPGGLFFQSLRSVYTMSRIAERERGRRRINPRARAR